MLTIVIRLNILRESYFITSQSATAEGGPRRKWLSWPSAQWRDASKYSGREKKENEGLKQSQHNRMPCHHQQTLPLMNTSWCDSKLYHRDINSTESVQSVNRKELKLQTCTTLQIYDDKMFYMSLIRILSVLNTDMKLLEF